MNNKETGFINLSNESINICLYSLDNCRLILSFKDNVMNLEGTIFFNKENLFFKKSIIPNINENTMCFYSDKSEIIINDILKYMSRYMKNLQIAAGGM